MYLENRFDLLFLKVHKTNAKAWFLQVWRSTCKTLVIVHVIRQVSPDFYLFHNFWKEKKSQVSPIHTTKLFGFW